MGHMSSILELAATPCNVQVSIPHFPFLNLYFCLWIWGAHCLSHLIAFMNLYKKKGAIYKLNVGKIPMSFKVLKIYI